MDAGSAPDRELAAGVRRLTVGPDETRRLHGHRRAQQRGGELLAFAGALA